MKHPAQQIKHRLPNGSTLYYENTEMGRVWYSDEIGGGVEVWRTCLVAPSTLQMALAEESRLQIQEHRKYLDFKNWKQQCDV